MAKKTSGKNETQFVTVEQFSKLEDAMVSIAKSVNDLANKPAATVTPATVAALAEEKKVADVGAKYIPVNPEWQAKAEEILGKMLDHCEMIYPRSGGIIFTVVIKPEFSNAPKDYLKFYKADRRSKEIGSEGIDGVEQWCKLIKQNLARPHTISN